MRYIMVYFFCLNCGLYLLRPLRDELVLHYELHELPYFFSGTFVLMLLVMPLLNRLTRWNRQKSLIVIHGFFVLNLGVFWGLFQVYAQAYYLHLAFFVWLSVFNLLSVSLFWSFITDLFSTRQAKDLFAQIALTGSLGAITGSVVTFVWVLVVPPAGLMLVAICMFALVVFCIIKIQRLTANILVEATLPNAQKQKTGTCRKQTRNYTRQIGWLVLCYTFLSTFLYFEQARLLTYSEQNTQAFLFNRTAVLAFMAFGVNSTTLVIQVFLTRRVLTKKSMAYALSVVPSLMIICLISLSMLPVLLMLVVSQVIHKTGNYALMRPARESLFTLIHPEKKYQVKLWIDMVIYRGGDVLGGWLFFTLLAVFGLDIGYLTLFIIPVAYLWQWQSRKVGRLHEELIKN